MAYTLEKKDYVLAGKEGVGTYGAGAALTVADSNRCQGFTLVNTPTLEETNDKTPKRNGLPLQNVGETNDWTWAQWFRDYTVPDPDDATRPTIDVQLETCGFIQTYSDLPGGPGVGPFTRTYTLQDAVDLMNSSSVDAFKVHSDAGTAEQQTVDGMRGTATIKLTPGRPWDLTSEGKAIGYVGPTTAGPVLSPTYPANTPVRFAEKGNVVLSQVGGANSATYTGPVMAVEIRCLMEVGETPGGDQTGVDEVTLMPKNAYEWDVQIDREALVLFNAKDLLDVGALLTMVIDHPTATPGNSIVIRLVGQAMTIEEGVVSNGRETYTIKCKGVYDPAGLVPTPAFSIVFTTV